MIDKALLEQTVIEAMAGTDLFLVDITVGSDNRIVVEVDSATGVDIDICAAINRAIEAKFDRDVEDYELEVGSAGLTSPFKVRAQYEKNLGNEVEVLTRDGRKFSGVLTAVDADTFTVEVPRKVKPEGAKRPVIEQQPETVAYANAKSVKYIINFK
jgi:ribosome maturation factor RimP